jgi:uncharacterized membrane protein YfcA
LDLSFATALFFAAAIPAVVINGIGKGGFAGIGMVSMPMLALVVPPLQAASILVPILIVQDAYGVWLYRRTWDARSLKILVPGAAVGIPLAYLMASRVPTGAVEIVLGIITLVFGARQMWAHFRVPAQSARKPGVLYGLVAGAAAGFTSMIAHAGAPPFQMWAIPQRLPRDVFVGTSVVFFAMMNWMKLVPYFALGELNLENTAVALILMPIALASTWLGVFLVRRSSGPLFYAIIYGLMILLGANLVSQGAASLW